MRDWNMKEQIKELCIFMICGQTLLHFQSGKKYEKICRMILELLVLAGAVGMILNFLQSLGIQKGEMQALGGAVANMQRSMEEALSRQLEADDREADFLSGISMDSLVEKYTMEEIKTNYDYFAGQYGYEIDRAEQEGDILRVFLKEKTVYNDLGSEEDETDNVSEQEAGTLNDAGDPAEMEEIQKVEIEKIELGDRKEGTEDPGSKKEDPEKIHTDKQNLETFRRQLALVFAMEEEKLEVILID